MPLKITFPDGKIYERITDDRNIIKGNIKVTYFMLPVNYKKLKIKIKKSRVKIIQEQNIHRETIELLFNSDMEAIGRSLIKKEQNRRIKTMEFMFNRFKNLLSKNSEKCNDKIRKRSQHKCSLCKCITLFGRHHKHIYGGRIRYFCDKKCMSEHFNI